MYKTTISRVIALSDVIGDEVSTYYGIKRERVITIPNAVDYNLILKKSKEQTELDNNTINVAYIGRLVPQKNPLAFVDCCKRLLDRDINVRGLVLGDGPLRSDLIELIGNNGLEKHEKKNHYSPSNFIRFLI